MEKLGINLTGLIFQLTNFLILFFILAKAVYPLILKTLKNRSELINEGITNTTKVKQELELIEQKKKEVVNKAMHEAAQIVKEAKEKAETTRKELLAEAQEEAKQAIAKADEEIKTKEKNALKTITGQAIELSLIAAEKILNEKVTSMNQDELIKRSLKEFDKAYE